MARSYKRDSRGRFAGGGGGSSGGKRGGGSGGPKRNKSRVTTTGSFVTRQRGKLAQQKRTKAFSSKATTGRAARDAWKKASGEGRKAAKGGKRVGQSQRAEQRAISNYNKNLRATTSLAAGKKTDVGLATSLRAIDSYRGKLKPGPRVGFTSRSKSTNRDNPKAKPYARITAGTIDKSSAKTLLASRSSALRQASSAKGADRRRLLGIAGRQAESLSIGGNAPNRTGRGNNQLTRAGRRAAANYVRIERQLANATTAAAKKKLQKKLDTAFAAVASLPKTRLPR